MAVFPPITVRQPRPHDIVDDPVGVCGVGTGVEGVISARVRDNSGTELREVPIMAGARAYGATFGSGSTSPGARRRRGARSRSSRRRKTGAGAS
jgi:immunoglobulin-like protein involved in spore germination